MFGGNGGLLGFTISNKKYPRIHVGLGGFKPPPFNFNGQLTNFLFTFLGISSCKLTNFVIFGICGLDLTPSIIWTSVDTNEASVTVIIYWGIAIEYNGINLIGSILKFEVLA
jgi:hypothetical protein